MSAPDSITTLVEDRDGVSVVSVTGEIDLVTAPALEQALGTVIADDPTALVIDLSAVEFLGSVGLKILAATYEKLDKSTEFGVVARGPAIGCATKGDRARAGDNGKAAVFGCPRGEQQSGVTGQVQVRAKPQAVGPIAEQHLLLGAIGTGQAHACARDRLPW